MHLPLNSSRGNGSKVPQSVAHRPANEGQLSGWLDEALSDSNVRDSGFSVRPAIALVEIIMLGALHHAPRNQTDVDYAAFPSGARGTSFSTRRFSSAGVVWPAIIS